MFINFLICNYNTHELLLTTSILAFALNAWVALIFIMELIVVLLLTQKNATKDISTHCLGLHYYISSCSTNNIDTILHHF
jgi:hypothetical protein